MSVGGGTTNVGGGATGGGSSIIDAGAWLPGSCVPVSAATAFPQYPPLPGTGSVFTIPTSRGSVNLTLWADGGPPTFPVVVRPFGGGRGELFNAPGTFFATSGEVTMLSGEPGDLEVRLELRSVRFEQFAYQVTDAGSVGAPKDGGLCAVLDGTVSTLVAVGTPCTSARRCGAKVCSPTTATCQPSSCDGGVTTPTTQCLPQSSGAYAEYARCDAALPCPSGFTCSTIGALRSVCLASGAAAEGQRCTTNDISTTCQTGLQCWGTNSLAGGRCVRSCSSAGGGQACSPTDRCAPNGLCLPLASASADPAMLGQACMTQGAPCGDDGQRLLGVCERVSATGTLTCLRGCTLTSGCASGSCRFRPMMVANDFTTVGVCAP